MYVLPCGVYAEWVLECMRVSMPGRINSGTLRGNGPFAVTSSASNRVRLNSILHRSPLARKCE